MRFFCKILGCNFDGCCGHCSRCGQGIYCGNFIQIGWIEPVKRWWFWMKLKLTTRHCEECGRVLENEEWIVCDRDDCYESHIPF